MLADKSRLSGSLWLLCVWTTAGAGAPAFAAPPQSAQSPEPKRADPNPADSKSADLKSAAPKTLEAQSPDSSGAQVAMTPGMAVRDARNALDRAEAGVTDRPIAELLAVAANRVEFLKRNDPLNTQLPLLSGRLLAAAGRPREAVTELQKFVESREGRNDWSAYRRLGQLLVDDYPRLAKANFDKADQLNPGVIEVRYGQARCAAAMGKLRDAVRLGREVVEQDEYQSANYLAFFAQALFAGEHWSEAEDVAAKAVEKMVEMVRDHPGAIEPQIALDTVYSLLIQTARVRITVTEPTGEDYIRLAHYLRDQISNKARISRFEVLSVLEKGALRFADEPSIPLLIEYGIMADRVGRRKTAKAVFDRVIELDPENGEARARLAQYEEGQHEDGQHEDAQHKDGPSEKNAPDE